MKIIELKQKLAKLTTDQRAMLDKAEAEKRALNTEEQASYDAMDAEYVATRRQIEQLEALEKREAELAAAERSSASTIADPTIGSRPETRSAEQMEELRATALQGAVRALAGLKLEERHQRAVQELGIDVTAKEIVFRFAPAYRNGIPGAHEARALSVGTNAAGGFTVPQGFVNNLERALLQYGGPRAVASVIQTATGNALPWPTVNDTSNKGALLAESTTFGASVDPTFAQVTFNAYKFSSTPMIVSYELLQDSAFPLAGMMGDFLGERIGRIQSDFFTTGTGSSQPQGIVTGATLGKTGASATAIAADELLDLQHSVDPAYRADPSAGYMFNDAILLALRKLKDTTNQYLIQPRITEAVPAMIQGFPFTINQSMTSAITTGQKTMLFGAMRKFQIRDVTEIRLVRLNELFAQTDQVGFVMFMRSDSKMLNAGTNPVKYYAQA